MIWKRCPRCGKRLLSGTRCGCYEQYNRERHKSYDSAQRNQKSKSFYNSAEWLRARDGAITACHGIDVYRYMLTGEIAAADTVHHITPISEDWSRRTDPNNLLPLSGGGHASVEQKIRQYTRHHDNAGLMTFREDLERMLKRFKDNAEAWGV